MLNPDTGAIAGYKDLNAIGQQVSSRLIRRTKKGVALQLPKRSDQYILVPMTEEQQTVHAESKEYVARIYRLGQQQPVQIINLVSKDSIEEGMIAKLKFKTSMFEGVLDGGDDAVFVNEDKFKKFMEDLNGVMESTPESTETSVEAADETDTFEEEMGEQNGLADGEPQPEDDANATIEDDVDTPVEDDAEEVKDDDQKAAASSEEAADDEESSEPTSTATSDTTDREQPKDNCSQSPQQLINQGLSFFCGLAETLKSLEATQKLIDNIVEVDATTGQTNIKIPVASKETVASVFQLFGKLFGGMK